jgi:hypothetical protein
VKFQCSRELTKESLNDTGARTGVEKKLVQKIIIRNIHGSHMYTEDDSK